MRAQKMVSLTDDTWEIASKMPNFSQWVRIGLREHANGTDLATESRARIKFARAAYMMASRIQELNQQIDPTYSLDLDTIVGYFLNEVTLEAV